MKLPDDWGFAEWLTVSAWTVLMTVIGFLWRLSVKVALLDHLVKKNDADTERRHIENVHIMRGVQANLQALSNRIDRIRDR